MKKIRWGLLGAGVILDRWLKGFIQVEDAEIAAIASRTVGTAEKQAAKYGIADALSYEEILKRDDIDVMYVPVPHTAHKELAMRAMEAGFPVLVEKPAAVTAADWDEMTACAERNGVFLMEAMWTKCFPISEAILREIREGTIGEVQTVQTSFSFTIPELYDGRLTDPARAGGALLDIGVYGLHFAGMIYGRSPVRITSLASGRLSGEKFAIDEQGVYLGLYENGALSVTISSLRGDWPDTAWINGTRGSIRVPMFWKPTEMEILCGGTRRTVSEPVPQAVNGVEDEGYQYEIRHVQACLRAGMSESPLVPHSATKEILLQCDELRKQWGLRYPFEECVPG